jgi:hypothetical protein
MSRLTPQPVVDQIYLILDALESVLTEIGFPYCTMDGTLLGAVRHGGMIPWDDDADLFIRAEDTAKLSQVAGGLREYGFELIDWWWGYKVYPAKLSIDKSAGEAPFPSVDLFPVVQDKHRLVLSSPPARARWPNEYMTCEEWERRARRPFGPLLLSMPTAEDETQILNRLYGPNWNETVFQVWDHKADQPVARIETPLTMRQPALPTPGILPVRKVPFIRGT